MIIEWLQRHGLRAGMDRATQIHLRRLEAEVRRLVGEGADLETLCVNVWPDGSSSIGFSGEPIEEAELRTRFIPNPADNVIRLGASRRAAAAEAPSTQPRGLYGKFRVERTDGRDAPGGDRAGAEYIVLDITYDAPSREAALVYASLIAPRYPVAAAGIIERVRAAKEAAS